MNRFQAGIEKLKPKQPEQSSQQEEPATLKTAERIAGLVGHRLTSEEKKRAEPLVHYGFGTIVGGIYGAVSAKKEAARAGTGTVYGATVWLVADELAVPAAGLSGAMPAEIPWTNHLQYLAAHLIYGLTLECVRRLAVRMS